MGRGLFRSVSRLIISILPPPIAVLCAMSHCQKATSGLKSAAKVQKIYEMTKYFFTFFKTFFLCHFF